MMIKSLLAAIVRAFQDESEEPSLLDGSELTGDKNFRTDRFDCGTDPAGFYEEDL